MKTTQNYTELEQIVIDGIKGVVEYEDCNIERLEEEIWNTKGDCPSTKKLRGSISSLVKKDIVAVCEGWINLTDNYNEN